MVLCLERKEKRREEKGREDLSSLMSSTKQSNYSGTGSSFIPYAITAAIIRLALLAYGTWQDKNMNVKFTDIDYNVISDAAGFVISGLSPFQRTTYRYTPLFAYLMIPNYYLTSLFGKIVFGIVDILAGYLISKIASLTVRKSSHAHLLSALWLFNPLVFTVSMRGNADSVVCFFVLTALYLIKIRRYLLAAIVYGFTIHLKIYPIIYSLPFVLYIGWDISQKKKQVIFGCSKEGILQILKFATWSALVFIALTSAMYHLYGNEYLSEALLYHITRKDHRHNFSPYFYSIYLMLGETNATKFGLLAFIPQFVVVFAAGVKYAVKNLEMALFLQTFLFVTFNKVCTSQYFLWYIALLPLIAPRLKITWLKLTFMIFGWFTVQVIWLNYAYQLEFLGKNMFLDVWMSGLLFFCVNIAIASQLIKNTI